MHLTTVSENSQNPAPSNTNTDGDVEETKENRPPDGNTHDDGEDMVLTR